MTSQQGSRRDFVKKAAYVAPAILTLAVKPAYAGSGSGGCERGYEGRRNRGRGDDNRYSATERQRGAGLARRLMSGDI
jgi:hypothetical protein